MKVEVNAVSRGHMLPVTLKRISKNVEDKFELFAAMQVLSEGEIYGSKICAAFDRQHPRDLYEIVETMGWDPDRKCCHGPN